MKNWYYKLVSTRDDGTHYTGVWRRLRRACMYARARRGFRFSHKQSMQNEEDSKQLLDILSLWIRQKERLLEAFSDMR